MPTVGRVFAKQYKTPLKDVVEYVNGNARYGSPIMEKNGAISKDKLYAADFIRTGVDFGVDWRAPKRTIIDAILTQGKSVLRPKGAKKLDLNLYG